MNPIVISATGIALRITFTTGMFLSAHFFRSICSRPPLQVRIAFSCGAFSMTAEGIGAICVSRTSQSPRYFSRSSGYGSASGPWVSTFRSIFCVPFLVSEPQNTDDTLLTFTLEFLMEFSISLAVTKTSSIHTIFIGFSFRKSSIQFLLPNKKRPLKSQRPQKF